MMLLSSRCPTETPSRQETNSFLSQLTRFYNLDTLEVTGENMMKMREKLRHTIFKLVQKKNKKSLLNGNKDRKMDQKGQVGI